VLESAPSHVNYPHDDDLYQGNQWSQPVQNEALAEADVVLVIDSDVPWIPSVNRPRPDAVIYHLDVDPLKPWAPLWYLKARRAFHADALTAIRQINARLDRMPIDPEAVAIRFAHFAARHRRRTDALAKRERPAGDVITPEFLTACVRRQIARDAIVLSEGITNYAVISDHMGQRDSGTLFTSGASSLGWHGGAAIGAKLAAPQRTVVALTGDGSYLFSVPSTVHWMARRNRAPFLQVIYNNRGWAAPKFSTLQVHPHGFASRAADIGVAFDPPPDYSAIAAAAGGAHARIVRRPDEVEASIAEALAVVREERRAAVLDVWLPHL
jgi:acetolactate synthase-1/2/3 large subunit